MYLSALNATVQGIGITPDEIALILDSGASCTISPSKDVFVGPIKPVRNCTISGIANGLEVLGTVIVEHRVKDDSANNVIIRITNVLYVLHCPVRLICPQQVANQTGFPDNGLHLKGSHAIMHHEGHTLTIP